MGRVELDEWLNCSNPYINQKKRPPSGERFNKNLIFGLKYGYPLIQT